MDAIAILLVVLTITTVSAWFVAGRVHRLLKSKWGKWAAAASLLSFATAFIVIFYGVVIVSAAVTGFGR